jgi:hypothetical protein
MMKVKLNKATSTSLLVIAILFLLASCSDDPSSSANAGSGSSSFSLPSDVADSLSLSQLALSYYGDWDAAGSYNTDVELVSGGFDLENEDPTNIDYIYLELWDSSPTIAVDPGTYTFDLDNNSNGYISHVAVATGLTYDSATDEETWEYSAAPAGYYGGSADDTIVSGTVVVAVSGSTYTFTFDLTLADGGSISGTYTGVADYQQDLLDEE